MADIHHQFKSHTPGARVFAAIVTPAGLDSWWTLISAGSAEPGAVHEFGFGPEYQWRAVAVRCVVDSAIEWELTEAMEDWVGTRVGFTLSEGGGGTEVRFQHSGWTEASAHFRTSSFCWAMYLRLLKRLVETGEVVPYSDRLEV